MNPEPPDPKSPPNKIDPPEFRWDGEIGPPAPPAPRSGPPPRHWAVTLVIWLAVIIGALFALMGIALAVLIGTCTLR